MVKGGSSGLPTATHGRVVELPYAIGTSAERGGGQVSVVKGVARDCPRPHKAGWWSSRTLWARLRGGGGGQVSVVKGGSSGLPTATHGRVVELPYAMGTSAGRGGGQVSVVKGGSLGLPTVTHGRVVELPYAIGTSAGRGGGGGGRLARWRRCACVHPMQ